MFSPESPGALHGDGLIGVFRFPKRLHGRLAETGRVHDFGDARQSCFIRPAADVNLAVLLRRVNATETGNDILRRNCRSTFIFVDEFAIDFQDYALSLVMWRTVMCFPIRSKSC